MRYEYLALPAPNQTKSMKGPKTAVERLAIAVTELANEMAAEGWEYLRTETLTVEDRPHRFAKTVERIETVMIFRREYRGYDLAQPTASYQDQASAGYYDQETTSYYEQESAAYQRRVPEPAPRATTRIRLEPRERPIAPSSPEDGSALRAPTHAVEPRLPFSDEPESSGLGGIRREWE